jgi:hypothetical protein
VHSLFEALTLLAVAFPHYDVCVVARMPGWRWRIAENTIYLNGGMPVGQAGSRLIEVVDSIVSHGVEELIASESPVVALDHYRTRKRT